MTMEEKQMERMSLNRVIIPSLIGIYFIYFAVIYIFTVVFFYGISEKNIAAAAMAGIGMVFMSIKTVQVTLEILKKNANKMDIMEEKS